MPTSRTPCSLLVLVLLLVVSSIAAKPSSKPKPKPKPSPKPSPKAPPQPSDCRTALEQLHDYDRISGVFSAFDHSVRKANLSEWLSSEYSALHKLKPKHPGPVLVMPTNAAMNRWMANLKAAPNARHWDAATVHLFKDAVRQALVPWAEAHNRWPLYFTGCTLLGVTHDFAHPLNGMGLGLWGGKGPGLEGSLLSLPAKADAHGRRLAGSTQTNYGIAGQGYNTLVGFPNSFSGSGTDPGFCGNAIFQVTKSSSVKNPTPVSSLPQGSCSTQFSSNSYSTASQLSTSSSTSIGVSANYEAASFSANYNYDSMSQQSSSAQQSSFILNGQSSLGGYSINAAAGVLSPYYVTAVQNLCSAYSYGGGSSSSMFQSQLQTFAESYGSSYIKSFYYGGYAAAVLQMSSSSYSSLQSSSVSLSAAASVTFIQSGGSVSGSYSGDMSVGQQVQSASSTFQYIQIPSSTLVALTSSGNIDCTTWTGNLNASANSGVLAPMSYTIGDQTNILTGYPWLFGSPCTSSILTGISTAFVDYFSSCANSQVGCPPPNVCPIGSYGYATNQTAYTCVYCYDQNNVQLSPMCNIAHTSSCGYQQCNCASGYTSESQCNNQANPTAAGTCTASFTSYGCSVVSNACASQSSPTVSFCEYNNVCSCSCCTQSGCTSTPPACNPPPSPPSSPPSDCFPGTATVHVLGKGPTPISEVAIGDSVLAADAASGATAYMPVYLTPHRDPHSLSTYVNLGVEGGAHPLQLSPRHFIPVCTAHPCSSPAHWETRYARDVKVGDVVRVAASSSEGPMALAAVQRIWLTAERGAFNPFVAGGTLVVNGVLASDQSDWVLDAVLPASLAKHIPALNNAMFAPLRMAYRALGPARWAALDVHMGISWLGHYHWQTIGRALAAFGAAAATAKVARSVSVRV